MNDGKDETSIWYESRNDQFKNSYATFIQITHNSAFFIVSSTEVTFFVWSSSRETLNQLVDAGLTLREWRWKSSWNTIFELIDHSWTRVTDFLTFEEEFRKVQYAWLRSQSNAFKALSSDRSITDFATLRTRWQDKLIVKFHLLACLFHLPHHQLCWVNRKLAHLLCRWSEQGLRDTIESADLPFLPNLIFFWWTAVSLLLLRKSYCMFSDNSSVTICNSLKETVFI